MTADAAALASIEAATRELRLPGIRLHAGRLAAGAQRAKATYLGFLADTLSRLYGPHSSRNLSASLDELIVNTFHDPRGVVSTSRLHACASGVVVGGSHSDR